MPRQLRSPCESVRDHDRCLLDPGCTWNTEEKSCETLPESEWPLVQCRVCLDALPRAEILVHSDTHGVPLHSDMLCERCYVQIRGRCPFCRMDNYPLVWLADEIDLDESSSDFDESLASTIQAFINAAVEGNLDVIRVLLTHDAITNDIRGAALYQALMAGHMQIIRFLAPYVENRRMFEWALRRASETGNADLVQFLLPYVQPFSDAWQTARGLAATEEITALFE